VTAAVINPELATNKCLELVAETTAPALSLEDLLDSLPSEITKVRVLCMPTCFKRSSSSSSGATADLREEQEQLAVVDTD
jgi:hypothetical protein